MESSPQSVATKRRVKIIVVSFPRRHRRKSLQSAPPADFMGARLRRLPQSARALIDAREAELHVLRAQLNPHFLFNALNSILAEAGEFIVNPAR